MSLRVTDWTLVSDFEGLDSAFLLVSVSRIILFQSKLALTELVLFQYNRTSGPRSCERESPVLEAPEPHDYGASIRKWTVEHYGRFDSPHQPHIVLSFPQNDIPRWPKSKGIPRIRIEECSNLGSRLPCLPLLKMVGE